MLIQFLVPAEIFYESLHAECIIILITNHGDGTHTLIVVMLIQPDLDLRSALLLDGYNSVSLRPVRDSLIDESKDNNSADFGKIMAINPQILARGNGSGAVIPV